VVSPPQGSSNATLAFELNAEGNPGNTVVSVTNEIMIDDSDPDPEGSEESLTKVLHVDTIKEASKIEVSVRATATLTVEGINETRTYTGKVSPAAVFGLRPRPPVPFVPLKIVFASNSFSNVSDSWLEMGKSKVISSVNKLHQNSQADLKFTWRDQGSGNRKGKLRVRLVDVKTGDTVALSSEYGFAPHEESSLSQSFDFDHGLVKHCREGYVYIVEVIVGGGGGHALYVENFEFTCPRCLVQPDIIDVPGTFQVITVSRSNTPPAPDGLKMVAPDLVPVLRNKGFYLWAYSFFDNREAFQIIMFDAENNIVKEWYKQGARNLNKVLLDVSAGTVSFVGWSDRMVDLTLEEIEATMV